jgi:hypothetical protein
MNEIPCVIVECSGSNEWESRHALRPSSGPRVIPVDHRPTILQLNRTIAEAEAERLARLHPGKAFVIFEAVAVGVRVNTPTHVNHRGEVLISASRPSVLKITDFDDTVPF